MPLSKLVPFKTTDSLILSSVQIGSPGLEFNKQRLTVFGNISSNNLIYSGDSNSDLWKSAFSTVFTNSAGWGGEVVSQSVSGSNIPLGSTLDGSLSSGVIYQYWQNTTKVTEAIDDLNEVIENIRRGTFIKSITASVNSPSSIGAGGSITVAYALTGNNTGDGVLSMNGTTYQFAISWGDDSALEIFNQTAAGTFTKTYGITTPSGYKNIALSAYHVKGTRGSGSFLTLFLPNAVLIYTANPLPAFALYKESSGGTALINDNRWIKTGDTVYMQNNSQNCDTVSPNAASTYNYRMYWDTSGNVFDSILSNADAGGRDNFATNRLEKNTAPYTSPGYYSLRLDNFAHPTANPAGLPYQGASPNGINNLKVYDAAIAAPQNLSGKTSWTLSGTQKKLCADVSSNGNVTDVPVAGADVLRFTTGNVATGNTEPGIAYYENNSTVQLVINDTVVDGSITLLTANNNTNASNGGLTISQDTDYSNNATSGPYYNATGSSGLSFINSLYYPGLYKGFKALASKTVTSLNAGVNSYRIRYKTSTSSTHVSTNKLVFCKDTHTQTPLIDTSSSPTIVENTQGTLYRVSGIPYYRTGGIIQIQNLGIDRWIGQTYESASNPLTFSSSSNLEGTGSIFSNQTKSFLDILGISIPLSGTGLLAPYNTGNQNIILNGSGGAEAQVNAQAFNVNGSSPTTLVASKKIQAQYNAPTFKEYEMSVTYDGSTFAKRLSGFVPNVAYNNDVVYFPYSDNINYYQTNSWNENRVITVANTKEAIVRFTQLKYVTTDFSSHLPTGPDLSLNRSGPHYFVAGFTRDTGQNFNFNINGNVNNFYIAAPGITNNATTFGWISATKLHNGVGIPGPNGNFGCIDGSATVVIPRNQTINSTYRITLGQGDLATTKNTNGGLLLFCVELASTNNFINSISISKP